jgi:sec-independent protein translocase protein TatA
MFRNPTTDLIVVLVIVLLILGPKRLPGLGKSLGTGMREFKDSISGESKDEDEERPAISAGNSEPVPTPPVQQAPPQPVPVQQAPPQQVPAQQAPTQPAPAADRGSAEVGSERNS